MQWRKLYDLSSEQSRIILIIVLVLLTTVSPIGWHIVVLNVPEKFIQKAIETQLKNEYQIELAEGSLKILWSFIVSAQSIGALFGCLALIPFERSFGVKNSLFIINNTILFLSSVCFFLSFYVETTFLLIAGRLLIGIYTGLGTGLLPIYIQELAPTKIKGALSCLIHIAILVFLSLQIFLGNGWTWHLLLSIPAASCIIQTAFARFFPHTPGYFLTRGQSFKAADSVRYYYRIIAPDDAAAIHQYRQLVPKYPDQYSFWTAMRHRRTRIAIGLGMLVSSTQIFSGAMASVAYSTSMFQSVSIFNSFVSLFPTLGSLFSILLSLPALRLVETSGRKPLLLNTLIMCAVANYLLCVISVIQQYFTNLEVWGTIGIFFSFFLLGLGYNLGVGPVGFFLPIELVDVHFVSAAMSCAVATNWLLNMVTTLIYYPVNEIFGGWSYLMFAVPTTLAILLLKQKLPETKHTDGSTTSEVILSCNAVFPIDDEDQESAPIYGTFD
ncbi:MFS domain-containing protein [Aphelenchoides besseyi]|nr:MFS domain-containing protein [Aphelenchoides besseyi]